jgi:hypothetical protein
VSRKLGRRNSLDVASIPAGQPEPGRSCADSEAGTRALWTMLRPSVSEASSQSVSASDPAVTVTVELVEYELNSLIKIIKTEVWILPSPQMQRVH